MATDLPTYLYQRTNRPTGIVTYRAAIAAKNIVDRQNSHHPEVANKLVIATLLNPPKLCWFSDNAPLPPNNPNLMGDIKELNAWICMFNKENGKNITPNPQG